MTDYDRARNEIVTGPRQTAESVSRTVLVAELVCDIRFDEIVPSVYWTRVAKPIIEWCGRIRGVYLYTIGCSPDVDASEVLASFTAATDGDTSGRSYCRINDGQSSVLFAGSSRNLPERIKQHFGYGPKGTRALNLCEWATDLSGTVVVSCMRFADDTPADIVQALEDGFRRRERPMFGP